MVYDYYAQRKLLHRKFESMTGKLNWNPSRFAKSSIESWKLNKMTHIHLANFDIAKKGI